MYIYVNYKETIIYSLLHCFRPSPMAGMSHLRCHSAPVGFVGGVLDAFSSGKVTEWEITKVSFSHCTTRQALSSLLMGEDERSKKVLTKKSTGPDCSKAG